MAKLFCIRYRERTPIHQAFHEASDPEEAVSRLRRTVLAVHEIISVVEVDEYGKPLDAPRTTSGVASNEMATEGSHLKFTARDIPARFRLMDHAPAMLGVLMNVEAYLRDRCDWRLIDTGPEAYLWRSVRDVITKATGEPNP